MSKPLISVIIGIRDWGTDRLEVAVRSHLSSDLGSDVEVIISDFGSEDPAPIKAVAKKYECKYVFTPSPYWSRSRSLNAGINAASADICVTTDADIIYTPSTLRRVYEELSRDPHSLLLVQCSDLPQDFRADTIEEFDWPTYKRVARTRPRWGMGGLAAFTKQLVADTRGYEERMIIWGAEDNDFCKRARASGYKSIWLNEPDVRIYHIWHEPFLKSHPNANAIFNENKEILNKDKTRSRNIKGDVIIDTKPIVSVVIATYNRDIFLKQCIAYSAPDNPGFRNHHR